MKNKSTELAQNPPFCKTDVRRSALSWWNKLTKSKQAEYEGRFFSAAEFWEDGDLSEADIIRMFQHFA